jgi:hypothetical protein
MVERLFSGLDPKPQGKGQQKLHKTHLHPRLKVVDVHPLDVDLKGHRPHPRRKVEQPVRAGAEPLADVPGVGQRVREADDPDRRLRLGGALGRDVAHAGADDLGLGAGGAADEVELVDDEEGGVLGGGLAFGGWRLVVLVVGGCWWWFWEWEGVCGIVMRGRRRQGSCKLACPLPTPGSPPRPRTCTFFRCFHRRDSMSQFCALDSTTCPRSSRFRSEADSPVSTSTERPRPPGPNLARQSAARSETIASRGAT